MPKSPLISAAELARQLGDPQLIIIDVRASLKDFAAGRRAYEAGHIPGAMDSPSSLNLGPDGLFKGAEELQRDFRAVLGRRKPERVILYCGSGVTACCNFLAMTEAKMAPAGVYMGSWSEWISDARRPVSTTDDLY